MLNKFEFQSVWISRLMAWVTTVSCRFLHNRKIFDDVQPQRGIRHGDPISLHLYILYAEGLSAIIRPYDDYSLIHD